MLAPLTIAQLEHRFNAERCPVWFAYEANGKKRLVGRFRDDEPDYDEDERIDYAWAQLEELISSFPYGRLNIVMKKSESSPVDKSPNYKVEWGVFPQRGARSQAIGNVAASGAGNWQMMQFFMEQNSKLVSQMHQAQMETLQLQFQNQMLQNELEADNTPSTQEKLLEEGIGLVKTFLTNRSQQSPAILGTMGQREPEPEYTTTTPAPPASTDEGFSIDATMGYVKAITDLFPQHPRIKVLRAFLALAKSNQAIIGAQLHQYITNEPR